MTTADYALIVSIGSGAISLFSLGWNVWQKFIYPKARLKVSFRTCCITLGDAPPWPTFIAVAATNFGPTEITINHVGASFSRGGFRKKVHAQINPIHNLAQPDIGVGPFGGGLPKKLAVGESHTSYFPHVAQSFARDAIVRIGFADVFGRFHAAPKAEVKAVRAQLDKEFHLSPYVRDDAA